MKDYHEYENQTERGFDFFTEKMKLILAQHQKKKSDSWETCNIQFLVDKLNEEFKEFRDAKTPMGRANECVDIANVCMILYNRYFDLWVRESAKLVHFPWER